MSNKNICIAIDGYAGTGKSTIGKILADTIGFRFLSTGSLYRAMAYQCLLKSVDVNNIREVLSVLADTTLDLVYEHNANTILINGEKVPDFVLRTREVETATSIVAKYPVVRQKVLSLQKDLVSSENIVLEGRDIGTVVAPDAQYKFFFTASPEVRAWRRFRQQQNAGENTTFDEVLTDIMARDIEDIKREVSPLVPARDAIIVDTADVSLCDVIHMVYSELNINANSEDNSSIILAK